VTRTYTTDLRCGACVEAIRPAFDADPTVRRWAVDLSGPRKHLTVEGPDLDRAHVDALLKPAGYATTGEVEPPAATLPPAAEAKTTYYPLLVVVAYILGVAALVEASATAVDPMRLMAHVMAGFFLVFSAFKLLDLHAFADSYAMYDVVARRSRLYALAYPFIELGLGMAHLTRVAPTATNAVTLAVMLVSLIGVIQTVVSGRKVRCACLGTVFALPMSVVTLVEDGTMAVMAAVMLAM